MTTTKKLSRNFDIFDVFVLLAFELDHDPIVVGKSNARRTGRTPTAKKVIDNLNALYKKREDGEIPAGQYGKITLSNSKPKVTSKYKTCAWNWNAFLDTFIADPKLWNWSEYRTKIAGIAMAKDPDGVLRVTERNIAYMVGVPALIDQKKAKDNRKEKMKALAENSNFFGTLKKRDDFFVKVLNKVTKSSYSIYELIDRSGNLGMFFSNDSDNLGLNVDDCALLRMTPKEHVKSTYHGGCVTKFNRPKVLQNVGSKE